MAKATPGHRIVLQLDPRVALEAIILNRLQLIPKARRQEWLRGLLVQGFRQECQTLQGMSGGRTSSSSMAFAPRLNGPMKSSVVSPVAALVAQSPAAGTTSKPFAALGKVIG